MDGFDEHEVLEGALALTVEPVASRAMELRSTLIRGLGVASRNLALQLPLIRTYFPEVAHCHAGTINVRCERAFIVTAPDHSTPALSWVPGSQRTEAFAFLRVELSLPSRSKRIPAWLYVAQNSPHRQTPAVHELIAPRLDLDGVDQLVIHLDPLRIRFA